MGDVFLPKGIPTVAMPKKYRLDGNKLTEIIPKPPELWPSAQDIFGREIPYSSIDHNKVTVTPIGPGGSTIDPNLIPKP
jgi:hypothetical protein